MKRIISFFLVLVVTAFTAFGQFTNVGKTVMYDGKTGRFLDPAVISSNQIVTAGGTNTFSTLIGDRSIWGSGLSLDNISTNSRGASQHGLISATGSHPVGVATRTITNSSGAVQFGDVWAWGHRGPSDASMVIADSIGAAQFGYASYGSAITINSNSHGAVQHVYSQGTATISSNAYGAAQFGWLVAGYSGGGSAENYGVGAIQLFQLAAGGMYDPPWATQHALTTAGGVGSILMGAGVASNKYSIVAGDGQVSHGDGSITAGGGLWGDGLNVSNLNAENVYYWNTIGSNSVVTSNNMVVTGMLDPDATGIYSFQTNILFVGTTGSYLRVSDQAWQIVLMPSGSSFLIPTGGAGAPFWIKTGGTYPGTYDAGSAGSTGTATVASLDIATNWFPILQKAKLVRDNTLTITNGVFNSITIGGTTTSIPTNNGTRINGARMAIGQNLSITNMAPSLLGGLQVGGLDTGGAMVMDEWVEGALQIGLAELGSTNFIGSGVGVIQAGYSYNNGSNSINSVDGFISGMQLGVNNGGYAHMEYTGSEKGGGSLQLFNLTSGQAAMMTGNASIGLGACTNINNQAIVAGDGQVSHGDGSISAAGGFWDNGVRLTAGGGGGSDPWVASHTGKVYGTATESYGIALGTNSVSSSNSVVIGSSAIGLNYSVVLGDSASATGGVAMAIGAFSKASSKSPGSPECPIAVGPYSSAYRGSAFGKNSIATGSVDAVASPGALALGAYTIAKGQGTIAIGDCSTTASDKAIASNDWSIAIGTGSRAYSQGLSVGSWASASTNYGMAIGWSAKAYNTSVALGYFAQLGTTATNSIQLGTGTNASNDWFKVGTHYFLNLTNGNVNVDGSVASAGGFYDNGVRILPTTNYITGFAMVGAGALIETNSKGFFRVPTTGTITQWVVRADVPSTTAIRIEKCTADAFPVTASIVGGAPMVLTTQKCATNATLPGWTKAVTAGDYLQYIVLTNTAATNLAIEIKVAIP